MSIAWTKKIYAWAVYINKSISLTDWKLAYMNADIKSANDTLFHNPNGTLGVNGTTVNWASHRDRSHC